MTVRAPAQHLLDLIQQLIAHDTQYLQQEFIGSSSTETQAKNEQNSNILKSHLLPIQIELNLICDYLESHNPQDKASLLSIAQLRGIYTGLELLWIWGLLPYLKMNHQIESLPKSILISKDTLTDLFNQIKDNYARDIIPRIDFIQTILRLSTCQMFRGMMLERNIKRVLCAVISILCENKTQSIPKEGATAGWKLLIESCQRILNGIIFDSDIPIPNVEHSSQFQDLDRVTTIDALRYVSLQGTSAMQQIVAGLSTMILVQPDGLRATLYTYSSGLSDSLFDVTTVTGESQDQGLATRLSQIAKLVTSLPSNLPVSLLNACCTYYLCEVASSSDQSEVLLPSTSVFFCVSIQLRRLMPSLQKSKDSNVMMLACVLVLGRLSLVCPDIISKFCLQLWFQPLLQIGISSKPKYLSSDYLTTEVNHSPLVSEGLLYDSVELLHIISTAIPMNQNLLDCLIENGIVEAIFDMLIYILLSAPLSELRALAFTISKEIITYGSIEKIVNIFEQIITFGWKKQYHLTSSGRIEIILPQDNSSLPSSLLGSNAFFNHPNSNSGDDSDYLNLVREVLREKEMEILDSEDDQSRYGLSLIQQVMERTRAISTFFVELFPTGSESVLPNNSSIPSSLFLRMLRGYLDLFSEDNEEKFVTTIPPHVCGIVLLVMKSHISLDLLLRDGYEILLLLGAFLQARVKDQYARDANYEVIKSRGTSRGNDRENRSLIEEISDLKTSILESELENKSEILTQSEEESDQTETISTVLALLGSMMEMGSMKRDEREEEVLRKTILPALQNIGSRDKDLSLSEMASDVALMIMVRGSGKSHANPEPESERKVSSSICDILSDCESDLADSEPPVRAYGIKRLVTTIRNSKESLSPPDILRVKDILIQMLGDKESFVYLAAVHALSRVIDMNRKILFPPLLELFGGRGSQIKLLSLRVRAALGEVLSISLRKAKDLAPLFVPSVVVECISICRQRAYLPSNEQGIDVNLSSMRITIEDSDQIETATDKQIEQVNQTIDDLSQAADTIYLRQSAYSLLSEAMACGGWTAGKYIRDTLDIAVGTLQMEGQKRQEHIVMRRSSVFMIKYILEGMKEKMFVLADGGDYLKTIYRILKVACRDRDQVIVFQAERAFSILESLVKDQFVPSDEIPKIRVLS